MPRDKRYNTLKKLIEAGAAVSILEILEVVPKTVISRDMGVHHQTFNKSVNNPENFTLKQIFQIASLIGVDKITMLNLVAQEILARDSKRKK